MSNPDIALLLSSYQRPAYLRRSLESIALQQGVAGRLELIVTDDGSTDDSQAVVEEFARDVPFPVRFTTHPHDDFQLSRCRNEGVRASTAPYLLFLDSDCILPPDHVRLHLAARRPNRVMAGDCCRLDRPTSERISLDVIRSGEFVRWAPRKQILRLRKKYCSSLFYRVIRHPTKPKLIGNNIGIWRSDYERVNGYDENFVGWGCEDDDLRFRLRRVGVRIRSILNRTFTYHLWHPVEATAPVKWRDGVNVGYLLRKGRLTRCRNGLEKRDLDDLAVRVIGRTDRPQAAAQLVKGRFTNQRAPRPEVEILFLPGEGRFSGEAECNVLVALEPGAAHSRPADQAHLLITPEGARKTDSRAHFSLEQFDEALSAVA